MKVSINWMKWYGGKGLDVPIDELVQKIGAQLGAVEEVIDVGAKYKGVVVAKVVSVADHPDADRLHVCLVDDGGKTQNVDRNEQGLVTVVCGAPNVREGIFVAWLPPGSTVPDSYDTDPFVLEARPLRGIVSNGMLASPKELAIGDNHDGILEIDQETVPGQAFAEVYELNDYVIDIENKMFTHRPDLFGQLGVAREIAGVSGDAFESPEWYKNPSTVEMGSSDAIKGYGVTIETPELCPRYMLVAVDNIEIKPSPVWLQTYLSRSGIRPINNVVDLTNYIMLLTAQPLHAFDFDKVAVNGNAQIVVRHPKNGEKLELLNGKTIEPREDAILICDREKPIGLAGIMGGGNSEIDANTKRILIECANFDMYNIRKSSMAHGLFSDAVTRFNKGQPPLQCSAVLQKTLSMLLELLPDAKPVGQIIDHTKPGVFSLNTVSVKTKFINDRLGLSLSTEEVVRLLQNVECVVETQDDTLLVTAPFWRTDIELPEDIVEEVGRLYGYDKLPFELPSRAILPTKQNHLYELKKTIRANLAKSGANELLTYSFVHENLLDKVGQNKDLAYKLSNALSPDLQYFRLSLAPSLLEKVHPNIKAGYDEFALFEIGKAHDTTAVGANNTAEPDELERVALVFASNKKGQSTGSAYFQARAFLLQLCESLGVQIQITKYQEGEYPETVENWTAPYDASRLAVVTTTIQNQPKTLLGFVGEYTPAVRKSLKLPVVSAGFELDTLILQIAEQEQKGSKYTPLPKFPKVEQDITLKVPSSSSYQSVYDFVANKIMATAPKNTHTTLDPLDIYQAEDSDTKNITLRLTIAHYDKTLTDNEVAKILDVVAQSADEISAQRI